MVDATNNLQKESSRLMTTTEQQTARLWFLNNARAYVDDCGEVDITTLCEDWADQARVRMGRNGLDNDHPAHTIAIQACEDLGLDTP